MSTKTHITEDMIDFSQYSEQEQIEMRRLLKENARWKEMVDIVVRINEDNND